MPFVNEAMLEAALKKFSLDDGSNLFKQQKHHKKSQKALVNTAYSFLDELGEDAGGVMLFVFHTVLEAFSNALPRPKKVSQPQIEKVFAELEAQMEANPETAISDNIANSPEPEVVQYIVAALNEESEVELTEQQMATVFAVLLVVTHSLHQACVKS